MKKHQIYFYISLVLALTNMDNLQGGKKKKGFTYTHFQTDTFFCFFCWTCGAFLFSFLCPCLGFWAFFVVAGLAAFFDLFLVVAYRIKIKIC